MVDPVTGSIIAASIASAAQGAGSMASAKAAKRDAKENKRRTLADMYNKALQRELDLYKHSSEQGGLNSARRASILQDTASGFRQALLGGG